MLKNKGLVRGVLLAAVVLAVGAAAGYSAPGGSSTVSVAVNSAISITVPATASIAGTDPGSCGSTAVSSDVNVKSNRPWNLQVRANPANNPAAKPVNGVTPMVNVFQYMGGGVGSFTNITTTYASLYALNQPRTTGLGSTVSMNYQQCVDWLDDPGTYTITVDYLGI